MKKTKIICCKQIWSKIIPVECSSDRSEGDLVHWEYRKRNRSGKQLDEWSWVPFFWNSLKYFWLLKAKITILSNRVDNKYRYYTNHALTAEGKEPTWRQGCGSTFFWKCWNVDSKETVKRKYVHCSLWNYYWKNYAKTFTLKNLRQIKTEHEKITSKKAVTLSSKTLREQE